MVKEAAVATGERLSTQEKDQRKWEPGFPLSDRGVQARKERELGWTLQC